MLWQSAKRLLWLTYLAVVAAVTLVGIDYGADSIKVSLLKSGSPIDIVLNQESKRKTPSNVVILSKDNKRTFGSDAAFYMASQPTEAFPALKVLLGKPYDHEVSRLYRERYPNRMQHISETDTVVFGDSKYTVEELIGMQLMHSIHMAEKAAGVEHGAGVDGAIIAIPPFYTPRQRQAMLDSAQVAGVPVDRLANDLVAVAVQWALNRQPSNETEYHVFFDMGAASTTALVTKFKGAKNGNKSLQVMAYDFDEALGGREIEYRLADHLRKQFEEQTGNSLEGKHQAVARFLKEAAKAKHVLSANTQTFISMEDVLPDVSFKTKVSRAELEELCADLIDRVRIPIDNAISQAGLSQGKIQQIVLFGGAVRVPMFMNALKSAYGEDRIATTVNQEEAATLGATYMTASQRKGFRSQPVKVQDISLYKFSVNYTDSQSGEAKSVDVFPRGSNLNQRKTVTFHRSEDFEFDIVWHDHVNDETHKLQTVRVTGVTDANLPELEDDGSTKAVKASIELSHSSMPVLKEVYVTSERKGLGDKVLNWFGKGDSDVVEDQNGNGASKDDSEDGQKQGESASEKEKAKEGNAEKEEAKPAEKMKDPKDAEPKASKTPAKFAVESAAGSTLKSNVVDEAKNRISELDKIENERHLIAKVRDELESLIYRLRDKFQYYGAPEDEGGDEVLPKVLTPEQKQPVEDKVKEFYEWLEDHGFNASLDELQTRQKALTDEWEVISDRISEYSERPKIMDHLNKAVTRARTTMADTKSEINKYADSETTKSLVNYADFEKSVQETEQWLSDAVGKLAGHVDSEESPVKVKEFEHQLAKVTRATDNYKGRLSIAERMYQMEEDKRKMKERPEKEAAEKAEREKKEAEAAKQGEEAGAEADESSATEEVSEAAEGTASEEQKPEVTGGAEGGEQDSPVHTDL